MAQFVGGGRRYFDGESAGIRATATEAQEVKKSLMSHPSD